MTAWVMSAVFMMSAASPLYLRLRKGCGSVTDRRCGPILAVSGCEERLANSVDHLVSTSGRYEWDD
jgi:hypothetical protein